MGLDRVKGYCEGHAPVRTPCIRGLGRVERSHNGQLMHVASVLVFIPFYASLIERIKSFFLYLFSFICLCFMHCYFRFESVVEELIIFFKSSTLSFIWINSEKYPLL